MKKKLEQARREWREAARVALNKAGRRDYYRRREHHFRNLANHFERLQKQAKTLKTRKHYAEQANRASGKTAYWDRKGDRAGVSAEKWAERKRNKHKRYEYLKDKLDVAAPPATGVVVPDRVWNPYRKPVAAWIVPWIDRAWSAGWRGVLVSGWRDPIYSEGLCISMCDHTTCPGRCAGRGSAHSGSTYPNGAIDVSDYYTFDAVSQRIGSPLKNDLPNDRVHFSYNGH